MTGFLEGLAVGAYLGPMSAPCEQAAPIYDGPAPRKNAPAPTYDEAAWVLLARRHPRFYKKLMRDMRKAQQLHSHYIRKVRI